MYPVAMALFVVPTAHQRLRGSASPVLTATHHSYGSPRLSDFFIPSRLWGSDLSTDIHAKWLKRRVFTQGCAFCSKSRYFLYPLISRPPKRSKFCKFLDLKNFRSTLPLTLEATERTPLILHRSPNKSGIVNRQMYTYKILFLPNGKLCGNLALRANSIGN